MAELKLPSLGEGIEKGAIINIMVAVGDTIALEQSLIEVETDKVVVEVPSDGEGTVTEILVQIGDEISEGTVFIKLDGGEVTAAEPATKTEIPPKQVVQKAVEKEAPVTVMEAVGTASKTIQGIQEPVVNPQVASMRKGNFRASPLARKLAREIGVDIAAVSSIAANGRISIKDVKAYARQRNSSGGFSNAIAAAPLPDFSKWGHTTRQPMSGIMQATSKNMSTAWSQIPHAWLQEKVDITYLEAQRQKHKHGIKAKGGSLTITGILVKVMAKALEDFPIFNASIDTPNASLVYKDFINIGVAVDTDRGLLVPVLKDANTKDLTDIAIELGNLADKVKQKKITADELDGATFTISNLGGIGTTGIFPLVSTPQVAILGVAASKMEPVYIDGQFQPRLLMPLTIGFDHRVINGADAARFLQYVKQLLEDWLMWSL